MEKVCIIQESPLEETPVICEISALLKKNGVETYLLIDKLEKNILSEIEKINPDVISIQAEILGEKWAKETLKKIREKFPSKYLITFGSLPTFYPEKIMEYYGQMQNSTTHHIIIGEPEKEFLNVIQKIRESKSKKNGGSEDKTHHISKDKNQDSKDKNQDRNKKSGSLQISHDVTNHTNMDWEIYYRRYKVLRDFPVKRFLASRGCLLSCSFCYISAMKEKFGEKMRIKEPDKVVDEIVKLKEKYRARFIHFSDDLFPLWERRWFEKFSKLWSEKVKLPFSVITLPTFVDSEVAHMLAESGCKMVFIGVETHNEKMRIEKLRKKGVTDDVIKECVRNLRENRIHVGAFVMLGLPGEDESDWFKTAEFLRKAGVDFPYPTVFLPIPKTPLGEETKNGLKMKSRLNGELIKNKTELMEGVFFLCMRSALISSFVRGLLRKNILFPLKALKYINDVLTLLYLKHVYGIGFLDGVRYFLSVGDIRKRKTVLHWVA